MDAKAQIDRQCSIPDQKLRKAQLFDFDLRIYTEVMQFFDSEDVES